MKGFLQGKTQHLEQDMEIPKKIFSFVIISAVLTAALACTAAAAFEDFTDVSGHWSERTLQRAYADGFLEGFEDGTLRPDEPITAAQMITILCRVLDAQEEADITELGIPDDTWYKEAFAKALYLGFISEDNTQIDVPSRRADAFVMSARAFGFGFENSDEEMLKAFSDYDTLTADEQDAIAYLFSQRYIVGYGGKLHADESITRAEFVTLLYKITDGYSSESVLKMVETGYAGNYTLEWALQNDYAFDAKEIWVNSKSYESETEYLIWVNLKYQRANIFQGSKGSWDLIRCCIVGTGAAYNATPTGVWKTTYKNYQGWTTTTYTVKPVVGFKGGGYAFHSRLYAPGTSYLIEDGIGYPISHGCIRMYDDDINWIYDNVPAGTTVVVY
jgi:hypothetical protein